MEYLKGGDALELMKVKEFTEQEVREAVKSLIDAVSYCFGLGIIHRDLKLENLLLPDGEQNLAFIKVVDFGYARVLNDGQLAET